MEPGEEISAEIDPGKTLEIRLIAVGETQRGRRGAGVLRTQRPAAHDPRANRKAKASGRRAAQGRRRQPAHVGAPMPGSVASVAVSVGQKVNPGDLLV
jgi:pyruvate carboxylase